MKNQLARDEILDDAAGLLKSGLRGIPAGEFPDQCFRLDR
jgi:hypothetical protein